MGYCCVHREKFLCCRWVQSMEMEWNLYFIESFRLEKALLSAMYNIYSTFAGLNRWAALLKAVTCPSSGGFVRLCRLLQDEIPCLKNIMFYYFFKGCFHDTAISNPAWQGHKIIAGLFGRTCFIWHVLGNSSTKGENKVAMFMAAGLSVRW